MNKNIDKTKEVKENSSMKLEMYDIMLEEAGDKKINIKDTLLGVVESFLKEYNLTEKQKGELARLRARITIDLSNF